MDFRFGRFHQLATRSRPGPATDGFAGWLQPSAATRKLFFYLSLWISGLAASISWPREVDLTPRLMDLGDACFHQLPHGNLSSSVADGFPG